MLRARTTGIAFIVAGQRARQVRKSQLVVLVVPLEELVRNVGPEFEQDRADTAFGRYDHRALERKPNATVAGWIVGIGNSSGCQVAH